MNIHSMYILNCIQCVSCRGRIVDGSNTYKSNNYNNVKLTNGIVIMFRYHNYIKLKSVIGGVASVVTRSLHKDRK